MDIKKDYQPVQSLQRTFQLMELLAMNPEGLSLLALSEKTGLPSSTVHRLLHSLYALGYTEWRNSNSEPYRLTSRLFEYGCRSLEGKRLVKMAHPFLHRLSQELSVPVYLNIPEGTDVLCIVKCGFSANPDEPSLGSRIPLYCSAAGKSILAFSSKEKVQHIFDASSLSMYTPNTIQSFQLLLDDVSITRRRGYSISKEEYRMGIFALAVPIMTQNANVFAALSITLSSEQFASKSPSEWALPLQQYASFLEANYNNSL